MKDVLTDNLTAPEKRPDRLAHGPHGFRIGVLGFAAPNHPRGIERQEAYCFGVKV
jgi:hypothetical protein